MVLSNTELSNYLTKFIKAVELEIQRPLAEDEIIKSMDFLIGYLDLNIKAYRDEVIKYICA